MTKGLPSHIKRLFWGDDLSELDFDKHRDYIIQTILERGDQTQVKWLFQQVSPQYVKKRLSWYKLSPKSANFWRLML